MILLSVAFETVKSQTEEKQKSKILGKRLVSALKNVFNKLSILSGLRYF